MDSRLLQRPTLETVVEPVSKFKSASLLSVLPTHMARGVTDTVRKVADEASATTSERLPAWVTISHHAASTAYPLFKAPTATCVLHTTTLKECVTHSVFPGIILQDITLVIKKPGLSSVFLAMKIPAMTAKLALEISESLTVLSVMITSKGKTAIPALKTTTLKVYVPRSVY